MRSAHRHIEHHFFYRHFSALVTKLSWKKASITLFAPMLLKEVSDMCVTLFKALCQAQKVRRSPSIIMC